jgi:hypothetical protein
MDEMNTFERRFEVRVRAFGTAGVRPVDSAAVARAVAVGGARSFRAGSAVRWLGFTFERRAVEPWRRARSIGRALGATVGIAATAVVAVALIGALSTRNLVGGPGVPASVGPSPAPTPASIVGLPPAGATLSEVTTARLVLSYEGNLRGGDNAFWLYADGRLIWTRYSTAPAGVEPFVGFTEQRLTPVGVESLRRHTVDTGLFSTDGAYGGGGLVGHTGVQVRNGDRVVTLGWCCGPATSERPAPSAAQAQLMRDLSAFLADRSAWPAAVWTDDTERPYLPARYAVCVRQLVSDGHFDNTDPAAIREKLPLAAQELLARWTRAPDDFCSVMPTADARELAVALLDARILRARPVNESWVRFEMADPSGRGVLWYSFEPVLPDGTSTWLGPG